MDSIDFPLQGNITYEIVSEAHKRLLMIAKEIKKVLNNHIIPYSIFFGTVIGAVRHKGFVPWDLDMDFGLFSNYDETISILKKELPSWLVVLDQSTDSRYCASWAKIVDRYSVFHATTFADDNSFAYRGLHIDLYNIKESSYNNASNYRRDEAIKYYKRKNQVGLMSDEEMNKKIININDTYEKELKSRPVYDNDIKEFVFLSFFEAELDAIFPLRDYIFEGEFFSGPNNYDKFLKGCYYKGDYMSLPPFEERDMKMDNILIHPIP